MFGNAEDWEAVMLSESQKPGHDAMRQRVASVEIDGRSFIDGRRTNAQSDARFDVIGVADNTCLATLADAGAEDVGDAVASARKAFDDGRWRNLAPSQRGLILRRFADLVTAEAETLGLLDTIQMGMPAHISVPGIVAAAELIRVSAELADAHTDQIMPSAPSALYMQIRRPRGIVAAITPWNYPVHVALAKIAPAMATGNCVILKPSEIAPLACLRLADLAAEAGVPPGVFNALAGTGQSAGRLLALHHDVDCLAFVGSTGTGLQLMQYAGQSNMKALLLECGGKSPQIVMDDCGDPEGLCDALVAGFTSNSGQVCVSGSRILLADSVYDALLPLLAEKVRALSVGHPLDPGTALAPLASIQQAEKVRAYVTLGERDGDCVARGTDHSRNPAAVPAHLFAIRDPGCQLAQDEIFGPVGAVMRFGTPAEAIRLANATRYGLSATIWSSDVAATHAMVPELRAGFVMANAVARPDDPGVRYMSGEPRKMSGFGVDGGALGMLSYTCVQAVGYHLK
jgi:acyl-CoA reductase-like NAD-dependent aldehyde dehydrogenase